MEKDIKEVLLSQEQIENRVQELANELSVAYAGKNPVFVGVMKGVVMFFAEMIKRITVPCQIDFMWLSSYSGTNSTGNMQVKRDISADLKGRHVIILEDIFDTGRSLAFTYQHLMSKEPASLKICTLLDKPLGRDPNVSLKADYVGFEIPMEFVVGFGLDYNEYSGIFTNQIKMDDLFAE